MDKPLVQMNSVSREWTSFISELNKLRGREMNTQGESKSMSNLYFCPLCHIA